MKIFILNLCQFTIAMITYIYIFPTVENRVGYIPNEVCNKYICSNNTSAQCIARIGSSIVIHQNDWCNEKSEFCFVTEDWDGMCIKKTDYMMNKLYSGEKCNITAKDWGIYKKKPFSECSYGPRKCDEDIKQCLGWGMNQRCRVSGDCNPDLYCSEHKACVPLVEEGGICKLDDACGHLGFCYYKSAEDNYGTCAQWMSIKIGEPVSFKAPIGDGTWSDMYAHRKCESYYVTQEGKCGDSFTVAKKLMRCQSDEECTTS